jgi:tetratricopeptide (TPR) repeat protein
MCKLSDYQAAVGLYGKALMTDPQSAPTHLESGSLYDEKLGDPIAAIYHYRQSLALQPNSDKQQLMQDFIERAKLSLAAKLPQAASVGPNEVARFRSENAGLIQENIALEAEVAELEGAAAAVPWDAQDGVAAIVPSAMTTPIVVVAPSTHVLRCRTRPWKRQNRKRTLCKK